MDVEKRSAAIVGAGLIGRAWAVVFARAGWQVRLFDAVATQLATARQLIAQSLADQEEAVPKGRQHDRSADESEQCGEADRKRDPSESPCTPAAPAEGLATLTAGKSMSGLLLTSIRLNETSPASVNPMKKTMGTIGLRIDQAEMYRKFIGWKPGHPGSRRPD